jgi:hypothetical protein
LALAFTLLFQTLSPSIFFFLNRRKKIKIKKKTIEKKRNAKKGGNFPLSSHFALSLLALASTLLFQMLSPDIFFFSNRRKEKKRNVEEGRELSFKLLLCPFTFGSHF